MAELVVVGAGPAGLAAAAAATRHGVQTLLLDRAEQPGGQLYARPLAREWQSGLPGRLLADLNPELLELRSGVEVWGAFADGTLAVSAPDGDTSALVRGERLLLAPGAVERTVPFPGWTLDSVITPGAAQLMLKRSRVVPAGRVVVAGSGPFLVAVAAQLAGAGVEVAALVEARPLRSLARLLPRLLGQRGRRGQRGVREEAFSYARALRRVPRRFGATIREARPGAVVLSTGETIACDLLCAGHGFTPRLELARQLGCAITASGVQVEGSLATTVAGVHAAGEIVGIGGGRLAEAEGRLAGLTVARSLGREVPERELAAARAERRQAAAFATRLRSAYPPLAVLALATPGTVVCRCEAITLGTIRERLAGWPLPADLRTLKSLLRCGMGACQGVLCQEALRAALAEAGGTASALAEPVARPPLGSVSVAALARLAVPVAEARPDETSADEA